MAVPNPEQELERARKLAKAGLPPVVVVSGPSDYFRGEALATLLQAIPKDADLRSVEGLDSRDRGDDDGADDDDAVEAAEGAPAVRPATCPDLEVLRGGGLFARAAFVVVRRGDNWLKANGEALAAFLPRIGKGSGLVVECKKLDGRKKASKQLEAAGAVLQFRELYETPFGQSDNLLGGELVAWVLQKGRSLGVPLTPEAALLLVGQIGKAPGQLHGELERLRAQFAAAMPTRPLRPDDLHGKLSCLFESTPFEFAEAVLTLDRARAFRSLRAMFDRGVKDRAGKPMDPRGVFPFLCSWTFRSLLQTLSGRELLDEGVPLDAVGKQVGVGAFAGRYAQQVQKCTQPRLRRGLEALLQCQRQLRQGEEPDLLLERFLLQWFDGAALAPALEGEP